MRETSQYLHWTSMDYDIRQIVLTDAYQAVWASPVKDGDHEGPHHLHTEPIDGIAIAKVTAIRRRRSKSAGPDAITETLDTDTWHQIVAIELLGGTWEIAEEMSNFVGLIRTGESPSVDMASDPKLRELLDKSSGT